MRSAALRTALLVAGAIPSFACSLITTDDCVSIGVSGIQVSVVDGLTRAIPAGAVVTIRDGEYMETPVERNGVFYGATERTGIYTVAVDAPGYARWTRDDINVVRTGSCRYLQTAALVSELAPSP